jgi:hypothetical protein
MHNLIALFYVLLAVVGGGAPGRDALDALSTEGYWATKGLTPSVELFKGELATAAPADLEQAVKDLSSEDFATRKKARQRLEAGGAAAAEKLEALHSKDAEVMELAAELSARYLGVRERRVRRLMAIRGLGEKKDATAGAMLKELLSSKEPFEAVYAARALAGIEGKAWAPADHSKAVAADLELVPKDATAVGQVLPVGLEPWSVEGIAAYGAASRQRLNNPPAMAEGLRDRLMKTLVGYLEQVGNFRVDGVTVGMNLDGPQGWVELIVHGEFDGRRVAEAVSGEKVGSIEGMEGVRMDRATVLVASPERLVALVPLGPGGGAEAAVIAALGGKGGLAQNAALRAEAQAADKRGRAGGGGVPGGGGGGGGAGDGHDAAGAGVQRRGQGAIFDGGDERGEGGVSFRGGGVGRGEAEDVGGGGEHAGGGGGQEH